MSNRFKKLALATGIGAALTASAAVNAQQVRLMTGPQGGSWYPLGGAIANIADKAGIRVQVLPGAGIANVNAVNAGKADLGFGNSISTVDGVAGREPFKEKMSNVCNVASLYPQYFQIVANADAGINSLADAKGKSIAVQPRGNTAEFISQQLLSVYGLKYTDLSRVSYVSYTDAVSLMKDNNAQLFTLGTTVPASAVMDLASSRDVKLVEVSDDKFEALRKLNPGYTKLKIPANSYPKQAQDVQAVGYATHLVARCDLDDNVVYQIVKGLVDNRTDLASIAKVMADINPKMMAEDIGVPLHKGAAKFYKERGAL